MKSIIVAVLFLAGITVYGQDYESIAKNISDSAVGIDSLIAHSTGAPSDVFNNTVTTMRNVPAIGMQETKITFYFFQKEDSLYESDDASYYVPRYSPAVKILAEYNIGTGQQVSVSYYLSGENVFYHFHSGGDYGSTVWKLWFYNNDMIKHYKGEVDWLVETTKGKKKFSKEEYNRGLMVMDNLTEYIKLYKKIFKVEQIDK